jgi:hypothetical protein
MKTYRKVYCVLSAKALPYFKVCFESLIANSLDPLDISLITDSAEDKVELVENLSSYQDLKNHIFKVFDKEEMDVKAGVQFLQLNNIATFRNGHPCWRKITDPMLLAKPGEEMVLLDPDLYFPNKFTFETTPESQLLLMWQPPSCLQPHESVLAAFNASVTLAHHVDIGVAQWRRPADLTWLDWLLEQLGGENIPNSMFVEAIVWSAIGMKYGGGHLNRKHWRCWYNSHWKRILIKRGFPLTRLLQMENLSQIKCLHATGPCKWWVKEAYEAGLLTSNNRFDKTLKIKPFEELTPRWYQLERDVKGLLKKMGYYSFINPKWDSLIQRRRSS